MLKKCLSSPDCLGAAVKLVARIGGYLDRSSDPPPGRTYAFKNSIFLQTHDLLFNSFLCNSYSIGHFLEGNGGIL